MKRFQQEDVLKTNEEIKQTKQAPDESAEIGKLPGLNLILMQRGNIRLNVREQAGARMQKTSAHQLGDKVSSDSEESFQTKTTGLCNSL